MDEHNFVGCDKNLSIKGYVSAKENVMIYNYQFLI